MQPIALLRQRFVEWVQRLDPSLRGAMRGSLAPWLGAGLFALVFILIAAWLPPAADFFQLRLLPALGCWLLAFSTIIVVARRDRRTELSPVGFGLALLVTSAALQFNAAALVALSKPPGSAVMAGGFILLAAYCGHHYRVTLRQPFGLLAVAAALLGALWIDASPQTLAVFAAAGPAAFGASCLLGTIADRQQRERVHLESLRAAVRAQILEERSRDVTRLSDAMLEVGQAAHDANNALFTALIEVDTLRRSVRSLRCGESPASEPEPSIEHVGEQLDRLRGLLQKVGDVARAQGGSGGEALETVDAGSVTRSVLRDVGMRFPQVALRLSSPDALHVRVCGGESSLRRVLENLVLNACEGDGVHGARHVEVSLEGSGVGAAAIRVRDDGAGFGSAELDGSIVGFRSVKPGGSGLGLYTSERLVRASRGSLRRENREEGGAVVTVFLDEGPGA